MNLTTPRYIVTNIYPYCYFEVGQIIEFKYIYPYSGLSFKWRDGGITSPLFFDDFKANFRPLAWYEFREVEDMLGYFKGAWRGDIYYFHCDNWVKDGSRYYFEKDGMRFSATYCTPITETDYTNYIKTKK
jgi:hypothetical protein